MNKEITRTICWDIEGLFEEYSVEEAVEIEERLPYETTFTMTDTYGECEEMDYLTDHYGCLVVGLEEEDN